MEFDIQIKNFIKELAQNKKNEEICGLIYLDNKNYKFQVYPCQNRSNDKKNNFTISPQDFLNCSSLGKITACYHSHINESVTFSEIDKNNSNMYNIHYILYNIKHDTFSFHIPNKEKNPYIGRPYIMGKSDCFTLMKEYALKEENINIYFPESLFYPKHLDDIKSVYADNFKKHGFLKLDKNTKLQKSDGLMMTFPGVSNDFPTHAAAYIGDGLILHHPFNSFSCVNIYDTFFKKHTTYVLRYKELSNGQS